ncbi:MAG TPA: HAMP domain-containing histidine kinase, partial [Desulfobacteraceae bacterium]|nr:HAMP domain-containing histidine kinase [Desulfobacteraceae bacterium]
VMEYFVVKQSDVKGISLGECILKAVDRAKGLSSHRDMEFEAEIGEDSFLPIDNDVLEKVFIGIIKNAIENTPDGGRIMVMVRAMPGIIEAEIKDTGVGITAESQKQIFSGFYHAKETDLYSTRSPFDFGAGGKGLDLLRVKIFSGIYQFNVECFSRRCKYIPGEKDSCPGAISGCRHIQNREECFQSGGTAFKLSFSTGRMAN